MLFERQEVCELFAITPQLSETPVALYN